MPVLKRASGVPLSYGLRYGRPAATPSQAFQSRPGGTATTSRVVAAFMAVKPCGQIGRFVHTWTSVTSPRMPLWTISTLRRKPSPPEPWLPICVTTLLAFAASKNWCASQMVRTSGFCTYTWMPIFIARTATAACMWSGVETVIAWIWSLDWSSSILR